MAPEETKVEEVKGRSLSLQAGLPVILIAVFALAALSFAALALLREPFTPPVPDIKIQNKISGAVALPPPGVIAQAVVERPPVAGETPPPAAPPPPAPPVTTEPAGSFPPPAAQPAGAGGFPAPSEQGPPPASASAVVQTAPGAAPSETPPATVTVAAATTTTSTTAPATATPAATEEKDEPAFPPPPPSEETAPVETSKGSAPEVPKPVWQRVESNWAEVKVDESAPAARLDPNSAPWKQIEVGEADMADTEETSTPSLTPPKLTVPSMTPAIKPGSTSASKSAGRKPASSAASGQIAAATGQRGLNLAVINESGQPGMAEAYRDVLQAGGYRVSMVEDRVPQPGPTVIQYRPGLKSAALTLARRIPGQRTVAELPAPSGSDIVILVR